MNEKCNRKERIMKKLDLQPTLDNVKSTFIDDIIERNSDLLFLIKLIDSIEDECYSIALDSYWGSGKTFFVRQLKMILDAKNEASFKKVEGKDEVLSKWEALSNNMEMQSYVPIYYDAWKNDNDEDPMYSLVYQMILETKSKKSIKSEINFPDVLAAASKITGAVASLGKITGAFAGVDFNEMFASLKPKDYLETLKERKDIDKNIGAFIDSLLPEGCDRLLIIIDELDRCNPKFAVNLLERIKHYFSNDKITFVFAVNLAELQITIRNYYGNEFNASRYLDRFFDRRVTLPPPDLDNFLSFIDFDSMNLVSYDMIKTVIKKKNMQMRECIKYVSTMNLLQNELSRYDLSLQNTPLGNTYIVLIKLFIPVVMGEMICNIFLHNNFINEKNPSLLTYFFNDYETIHSNESKLLLLYDANEDDVDNINKLRAKLQVFYKALMSDKGEVKIGKCIVTECHRKMFWKSISLLSDNLSFSD